MLDAVICLLLATSVFLLWQLVRLVTAMSNSLMLAISSANQPDPTLRQMQSTLEDIKKELV
jgi:hypothetical protein